MVMIIWSSAEIMKFCQFVLNYSTQLHALNHLTFNHCSHCNVCSIVEGNICSQTWIMISTDAIKHFNRDLSECWIMLRPNVIHVYLLAYITVCTIDYCSNCLMSDLNLYSFDSYEVKLHEHRNHATSFIDINRIQEIQNIHIKYNARQLSTNCQLSQVNNPVWCFLCIPINLC